MRLIHDAAYLNELNALLDDLVVETSMSVESCPEERLKDLKADIKAIRRLRGRLESLIIDNREAV